MERIIFSGQMKKADECMIKTVGMPGIVLMEHAAMAVCELVCREYQHAGCIAVICGSGNNGGDGFAAARLLKQNGFLTEVFFAGKESCMTEDCRLQKKIWDNIGGTTVGIIRVDHYDLIIDALFGIGLSRDIEGSYREMICEINASGIPVIAVDVPSGVHADTGKILGTAFAAQQTVTFSCLKMGLLLHPGCDMAGQIHLADIGVTDECIPDESDMFTLQQSDIPKLLPKRIGRSNKGAYGRALIIGGQCEMAGAVLLSAQSAYRCGSGLVTVMAHPENRIIAQSSLPEAVFCSWEHDERVNEQIRKASCIAIGPGLGIGERQKELLEKVLDSEQSAVVLDADALNLLANNPHLALCRKKTDQARIVTPHPGEMARLTGKSIPKILEDTLQAAKEYAMKNNMIVVLKDDHTIVTDGNRVYINTSGCDGMATGGAGDVLTGMIVSLCAQGMSAFPAACLGVYLHGLAGMKAQEERGPRSMNAGDIVFHIKDVIR